ncbi:tail fiber assembly protein [Pseudomonas cichorii]|nr:tail fiber assembly protein [Pseudomonas cichorii]
MTPLQPDKAGLVATTRDSLLSVAALRIAPLQDAVDLDDASDAEISLLKKWKQYRIAVNRLDLTVDPIGWPEQPQ